MVNQIKPNRGMTPSRKREMLFGYLFAAPALICIFVFVFWPVIQAISLSLYDYDVVSTKEFIGIKNFISMFSDHKWTNALDKTVKYAVMVPLYLLISKMGVTNSYWALILPSMATGYGIFMLHQFYLGIPGELEDAGSIDGLGYFGRYMNIIIPLSKPIMLALGLFTFIGCWNNMLWPLIVNTSPRWWVITVGLKSFQNNRSTDWNAVLTGAAVSMIPIAILFVFFQKHLVEGIKMSGMKL